MNWKTSAFTCSICNANEVDILETVALINCRNVFCQEQKCRHMLKSCSKYNSITSRSLRCCNYIACVIRNPQHNAQKCESEFLVDTYIYTDTQSLLGSVAILRAPGDQC